MALVNSRIGVGYGLVLICFSFKVVEGIVIGLPTKQGKLLLFSVPHKFDGMKPSIVLYCAPYYLSACVCPHTYKQTHTRTHTCNRLRLRTYNLWCVYLCVNVWVYVCNCNTEDTQLELYLPSKDESSDNRGRIHYSTQPPNADVIFLV